MQERVKSRTHNGTSEETPQQDTRGNEMFMLGEVLSNTTLCGSVGVWETRHILRKQRWDGSPRMFRYLTNHDIKEFQQGYLGISTQAQLVMHSNEPSFPWVDGTAHMKPHSSTSLELTCIRVVTQGERTTPSIACSTFQEIA